jgi:hypothetical protein
MLNISAEVCVVMRMRDYYWFSLRPDMHRTHFRRRRFGVRWHSDPRGPHWPTTDFEQRTDPPRDAGPRYVRCRDLARTPKDPSTSEDDRRED